MNTILVLCTGNICRSPMAAALLAKAMPQIRFFSAGTAAVIGAAADKTAVALLRETKVDISNHRSQQLSSWMLTAADLVIVMDEGQRNFVETLHPVCKGKVFRLCEFANADIPDPYRKGEAAFRHSLQMIQEGVAHWAKNLTRLTNKKNSASEQ
ncbi:low molecular weight protein-tyrosine-phosphatase [Paraburkholderia lacunae]|uniref:protein-tyrosine-phosphatase n=1 Tax=Paraburkholderia lacunae TaxID=2211104 RepID=A0A370NB80_9BURK|nr:low molecular weight protein-tyrosine-phosphatase [Paraburkholderia lacunae]RDK02778.1 protein tyrosine phosphatase [Paraburkholderia lacunae]